jgi:hypothetical protein
MLDDNLLQLPSGVFAGVESYGCYGSGELEGIKLAEKNMLVTHAGELIPSYTETHRRKNKYSVEFHKNGMVKAVALNEIQEIQTPIGEFPAELVTFFETGELRRFFPLDGKISGMWSEKEEKALALPLTFELPFTTFTAIIGGVAFYRGGCIRSVTLFPGERIRVRAPFGEAPVRIGFSLYESGKLESFEPGEPVYLETPVGGLNAFDPNAVGGNADRNSLVLDEEGRVTSLITSRSRVTAQTADGRLIAFSPRRAVNPLDGETLITYGLKVSFDYAGGAVTFADGAEKQVLPLNGVGFAVDAYSGG